LSILLKHENDLEKARRQLLTPPSPPRPQSPDDFRRFSGN
jgi:hypothetical protein